MRIQWVVYPSDFLLFLLVIFLLFLAIKNANKREWQRPLSKLIKKPMTVISMTVLGFFILIGLCDSFHYRILLPNSNAIQKNYSVEVYSFLDFLLRPAGSVDEVTYSSPFATHSFSMQTEVLANGKITMMYPPLQLSAHSHMSDLFPVLLKSFLFAVLTIFVLNLIYYLIYKKIANSISYKSFYLTIAVLAFLSLFLVGAGHYYHVFGTDKIGQDVFYLAIKSIRTGLILGTITTLITMPIALILGTAAGYFGGFCDDVVQYIYTTLSSIPGVLLIAASVLALQIFVDNHPDLFSNAGMRADIRLLSLCFILGITSWTSLCRLLRAETLKVREMDYVQAAKVLGASHIQILKRHVLPNVMYLVLITLVLDFSGLVLAEAVLTYVGVGVDQSTISFGNMINAARLELARDPVVWWPLMAAFILMLLLVLVANLTADAVRDAFDPRTE